MDNAEYRRIAEKYTDTVYRIALSYCGNKSDAEDAVQNAFYKLMKTEVIFNDDDHIKRWLTKTAINECKMMWRSFWHRNVVSFDDLSREPEYAEAEHRELFLLIMKLPEKYRTVLFLYYYEGYDCREISEILGITASNVQTRLLRARNKLKTEIKEAEL